MGKQSKNRQALLALAAASTLFFAVGCQANDQQRPTEEQTSPATSPTPETSSPIESPTATHASPTPTDEATETTENSTQQGEPVSTTNGAYTMTPVGDWAIELSPEGGPIYDEQDPQDILKMTEPSGQGQGEAYFGFITAFEEAPGTETIEDLESTPLPELDSANGQAYLIEKINTDPDGIYYYDAVVATVGPDAETESDARIFYSDREVGAFINLTYKAEAPGEAGLAEVREFLDSQLRTDAVEMLSSLTVEAP